MQNPTIGVVIGTYGDDGWINVAQEAINAAKRTGADKVTHVHGETLAKARNEGAEKTDCDYLVFCDADDKLELSFADLLRPQLIPNERLLYQVMTLGWHGGEEFDAFANFIPDRNMYQSNNLIIGTVVSREDFVKIGGFHEYNSLEDWDLFLRLIIDGVKVTQAEGCIYIVRVDQKGRNHPTGDHNEAYQQIMAAHRGAKRQDYIYKKEEE